MAKLSLVANPTFKAKVGIPVAGGADVFVEFTFKHRTRTQLDEFVKATAGKLDSDNFLAMVVNWELDDPFNKESVDMLLENYVGAGVATFRAYVDEIVKVKLGN